MPPLDIRRVVQVRAGKVPRARDSPWLWCSLPAGLLPRGGDCKRLLRLGARRQDVKRV